MPLALPRLMHIQRPSSIFLPPALSFSLILHVGVLGLVQSFFFFLAPTVPVSLSSSFLPLTVGGLELLQGCPGCCLKVPRPQIAYHPQMCCGLSRKLNGAEERDRRREHKGA